jgi:hypothetical protein
MNRDALLERTPLSIKGPKSGEDDLDYSLLAQALQEEDANDQNREIILQGSHINPIQLQPGEVPNLDTDSFNQRANELLFQRVESYIGQRLTVAQA